MINASWSKRDHSIRALGGGIVCRRTDLVVTRFLVDEPLQPKVIRTGREREDGDGGGLRGTRRHNQTACRELHSSNAINVGARRSLRRRELVIDPEENRKCTAENRLPLDKFGGRY